MKEWTIYDYNNEEINWKELPRLTINEYPWYTKGDKQNTTVQIAITQNNIHIHAKADDKYIRATAEQLNDPVHEDSCFEFFVTPWDQKSQAYFNIEVNCMGTLYMAYRSDKNKKTMITKEQAKSIIIESSLKDNQSFKDILQWELNVVIPIALLEEMANKKIEKETWYGNFYRCGGAKDDQYAAWNTIDFPEPSFHQPLQFGKLVVKERAYVLQRLDLI